jgi:hypothetical protein
MSEIYKDIPWYEWKYQVSNLWNIKSFVNNRWWVSKEWKILKMKEHSMGYKIVSLWRWNEILVHRLVAQAFLWLDINNVKSLVLHYNDKKKDNRLENLRLWTHSDNSYDMYKNKCRISTIQNYVKRWCANSKSKLDDEKIKIIFHMRQKWETQKNIWKYFWINQSEISRILWWKKWKHISLTLI